MGGGILDSCRENIQGPLPIMQRINGQRQADIVCQEDMLQVMRKLFYGRNILISNVPQPCPESR